MQIKDTVVYAGQDSKEMELDVIVVSIYTRHSYSSLMSMLQRFIASKKCDRTENAEGKHATLAVTVY